MFTLLTFINITFTLITFISNNVSSEISKELYLLN